jgi:hypothetical protein
LISWKARFDRRPVFGAALSSGLVGNFALGQVLTLLILLFVVLTLLQAPER